MRPFLKSQYNKGCPEFSPDGRWLAFVSNETGQHEVYVQPFPGPGAKVAVSLEGGVEPLWTRNQKQLFYRRDNQAWVVDVRSGPNLSAGMPRLLFEKPGYPSFMPSRSWDVSLDGRRFLMVKREDTSPESVI